MRLDSLDSEDYFPLILNSFRARLGDVLVVELVELWLVVGYVNNDVVPSC